MHTVTATADLVPFLLQRMGPARVAAMRARYPAPLEDGIANDIACSSLTWCGLDAIGVVTLGGIIPMPDGISGYVWQYVTDIAHNKRGYLQQHALMLEQAAKRYPRLVTIIEADHHPALRHAWRLGFAVGDPRDFGGQMGCLCIRDRRHG